MSKVVMCVVQVRNQAEGLIGDLQAAGFSKKDISLLALNEDTTSGLAHQQDTKAPQGAIAGAGAGCVVGTLGLLLGLVPLAIPGAGPFIAAGPLLAALGGAAPGPLIGAVAGAMVGMGFPEADARRYEGKVRGGSLLVSLHTESSDRQRRAAMVFREAWAEDICSAAQAAAPT